MCAFTGIFMHISSKNVTLRLWRCIWSAGTRLQCDILCHWTQSLNSINVTSSLGRGINLRAYFWAEQPLWGFSDLVITHRCLCQCMSWYWTAHSSSIRVTPLHVQQQLVAMLLSGRETSLTLDLFLFLKAMTTLFSQ